ncbi:hypothetical protein OAH77_04365 [Flavobacteriaceae bacterium]|nr:hypothetical protein [Flavobacteriaceae bacterium]
MPKLIVVSFLLAFLLILNETTKVNELYKCFSKETYSIYTVIGTVVLSILFSGLGFHFWTNETDQEEMNSNEAHASEVFKIDQKYAILLDSIDALNPFEKDIDRLRSDISFWQNRKCADLEERTRVRKRIVDIENNIKQLLDEEKALQTIKREELLKVKKTELEFLDVTQVNQQKTTNKSKFLFYFLLGCVLMIEIMVIYIQYMIVNQYSGEQRLKIQLLKDCLASNPKSIPYGKIYNHPLLDDMENRNYKNKYVENFYYLLGDLAIIYKKRNGEVIQKGDAVKKLITYFNQTNKKI